mmetsp:Transcript_24270/g.34045  ORF Transcript_24270/g.34045 Transcript_24270/m.34045 type:complete len:206 (+) Transcript_24270:2-619(+)
MSSTHKAAICKLVVIGGRGVGKTSLLHRYVKNDFSDRTEMTIAASIVPYYMTVSEDITIKFELWDTAGEERFQSLAPLYYRGAHVIIVVYDITDYDSFAGKAKYWINEVFANSTTPEVMVLVGSKLDRQQDRRVDSKEAEEYAKSINALFMEISSKSATNVTHLFMAIAQELLKPEKLSKLLTKPKTSLPATQKPPESTSCCGET